MNDHVLMARALKLAERGLFTTSPNPHVGCVIFKEGKIVGEGWHEKAGEPHAEVNALSIAGKHASGATVYVTLEPCNHFGRTPPCADALIKAGIKRVVVAMEDPNPLVAGKGLQKLRDAGIETIIGILEEEAKELNIGFVTRMQKGRPWIRIKLAASLDGKTALLNGKSQWITGEDARRDVHRLRARTCAMLTGIGTILQDDPQLNVRIIDTSRQPVRIVIDSRLETPLNAKILQGGDTIIATVSDDTVKTNKLVDTGAKVIQLPDVNGKVDLHALAQALGERGYNEITVEAGAKLNASLLKAGLIDELFLYQAPIFLGDKAQGLFALPEMQNLSEKIALNVRDVRMIGKDMRIIARLSSTN